MRKPKPKPIQEQIQVPVDSPAVIEILLKKNPIHHPVNKDLIAQKEHLLWFLHIVYMGTTVENPFGLDPHMAISSKRVREYDGHGEIYFEWLRRNNFIRVSPHQSGRSSQHFRVAKDFSFEPYYITTPFISRKIDRLREKRAKFVENDPLLSKLWKSMQKVTLKPSAYEWVRANYSTYEREAIRILRIIDEKNLRNGFWFTRGPRGHRVFTPLTNLKRVLRKEHLLVDGEEPFEFDIPCCQPQLLLHMLRNRLFIDPQYYTSEALSVIDRTLADNVQSDIAEFSKLFETGTDFYDFIRAVYNKSKKPEKHKTRDDIKITFMAWLGESRVVAMDQGITKTFEEHFPTLLKLIVQFKTKTRYGLTAALQGLEAKIIFEVICPRLFEIDIPFFTCHDSIIIPQSKKDQVREIWVEELSKLGIKTKEKTREGKEIFFNKEIGLLSTPISIFSNIIESNMEERICI